MLLITVCFVCLHSSFKKTFHLNLFHIHSHSFPSVKSSYKLNIRRIPKSEEKRNVDLNERITIEVIHQKSSCLDSSAV